MRSFAIGVLSELTGVKIPTIRFYESIGLLPAPERTQTNRRTYDAETVRRLSFIRRARELGFEMEAIRTLLDLAANPGQPCPETENLARRQLVDIDGRIAQLTRLRMEIDALLDRLTLGQGRGCGIVEALADYEGSQVAGGTDA
jgi:DNA-binding transcriptional MerR regulator